MAGILQVPLFSEETLPSWVARLARANGKLSSFSFCGDVGVDFSGMLLGRPAEVEMLASLTGRASCELTSHALVFGAGHQVQIANETVSKKFMRKNQLAFCPKCFADDDAGNPGAIDTRRYWRKSWLMSDAKVCVVHGCQLEGLPPHSRLHDLCQVLDRNSIAVAGYISAPVHAEPSLVDKFIVERLAGNVSHGPLLDGIPLGAAIHTARLLGVALSHGSEQAVTQLSKEEVALSTDKGMCVLQSGASGVRAALDSIVNPRATAIYFAYGRLANMLLRSTGDEYQPIKEIFIQHASGRFMLRGERLSAENKTWTSATALARVTGSSKDRVRRRLYETGITTSMNSETVPMDAVFDLLSEDDEHVKAKTACEIVGCDKEMFDSLVEAGLIERAYEAARMPNGKRRFQANFRRRDLVDFRQSVEVRAQSGVTDSMITLRLAARRSGKSKAAIIAGILSGEYKIVGLSGKALMADNVMLDFSELDPPGDFVTALQAATLLNVRSDTLAKLLVHGVIPYREVSGLNQRFKRKMVDRKDIADFVDRYVSIAQLVAETGLDRNLINARMRSRGVRPVFPPAEFKTAFIERNKVPRLLETMTVM
ncbi:TniQ family protein [Rhizobium sp. 2MFCol3.1]|uniref:TniQ family protein n=1 Tax=Rhizobium sp. 2MFCol3.1 TaxID=1246459 RepID=UPI00036DF375|nr:TniQ family protein [Rhizobium sp. 2MFCol3.1]